MTDLELSVPEPEVDDPPLAPELLDPLLKYRPAGIDDDTYAKARKVYDEIMADYQRPWHYTPSAKARP